MSKPSKPSKPSSSICVNLGSSGGSPEPQQTSSAEQAQLSSSRLAGWLSDPESRIVILGAQPPVADEQDEPPKPQGK